MFILRFLFTYHKIFKSFKWNKSNSFKKMSEKELHKDGFSWITLMFYFSLEDEVQLNFQRTVSVQLLSITRPFMHLAHLEEFFKLYQKMFNPVSQLKPRKIKTSGITSLKVVFLWNFLKSFDLVQYKQQC